jgi:hypothetical protein|uniref:Uncharacterized protein n=1 Tax=Myoviridae sp. ctAca11 TaxID=2825043 RepID=A0A8S5Q8A3_9CAUD|nr:MAG TPA: hypothetical protein [Myoviridae sp. ctAca11]
MRIDNSKIVVIIGFSAILRKSFSTGCNCCNDRELGYSAITYFGK